jgi:cytochrome d ubiquinol oxidase subunit I
MKAIKVVLPLFLLSAILTPISGDISAKDVAKRQPLKLAAMEAHFETEKGAGLWLGGIPDREKREVEFGIQIPYLLSLLATNNPMSEIKGLNDFPEDEWPPLLPVHLAFQVMVGIGTLLFLLALFILWRLWKKKDIFENRMILKIFAFATPLGVIAIEAGWIVTEVGRQPWIIYGILKTRDSVSPMPGLEYILFFFAGLYLMLSITVSWLMYRQFQLFMKKDNHV